MEPSNLKRKTYPATYNVMDGKSEDVLATITVSGGKGYRVRVLDYNRNIVADSNESSGGVYISNIDSDRVMLSCCIREIELLDTLNRLPWASIQFVEQ